MVLFLIYPGQKGAGLEVILTIYEISRKLGIQTRVFLSKDNSRKDLVTKIYPEIEFFDFVSPKDLSRMKKEIGDNWAFFTMISPKMIPLYLSLKNKLFYYHATYNYTYSKRRLNDMVMDHLHDLVIRKSSLTLVTQAPLSWEIKARLGIETKRLLHPPYSVLRQGFFASEKKIDLPFDKYFFYFGEISRYSKGVGILLKALEHYPELNTVIAGRGANFGKLPNLTTYNGWIDDGSLHYLIKNSHAVTLPYLVPAQFSGCLALSYHFRSPVICSRLPVFDEWVDEGKTGWFFNAGDYESLGQTMLNVWNKKGKFNPDAIVKKELEMEEKSKESFRVIMEELKVL